MKRSPRAHHPHLRREFSEELRWTFGHRRGWLVAFAANLVVAALFVGVSRYDTRTGGLRLAGLAAELAAWVIASTLTTNQLGDDFAYVHSRLERGDKVLHILFLKNLVLAALLVPVTVVVSLGAQLDVTHLHRLLPSVTEDLLDVFVVLLWLGIGGLTSVLLPYRPIPLRERWQARQTWPRWGACQVLPYVLFFVVLPPLALPARLVAADLFGGRHRNLAGYSASFVLWGLLVWTTGLWLAALYVRRAPGRFLTDLRRPS